jgi:PAS domain S-box-containing protein
MASKTRRKPPAAPTKSRTRPASSAPTPRRRAARGTSGATAPAPRGADDQLNPVIVGIGASAGGLDAFSVLLRQVPADANLAIVFVQHLAPQHESALVTLLSAQSSMPVVQAEDGTHVQANHVYVIPPNRQLTISARTLHLGPRPDDRSQYNPIDAFLISLARSWGARAIGVILSGTASDGAMGIREIRAGGGVTIVQTPPSAKYDGMPCAALATGMVDLVLPPDQIGPKLAALSRRLPPPGAAYEATAEALLTEDELNRLKAAATSDRDRLSLLHKISVYQEELLAQNDALFRAQAELEEARDRFIELYDFAPTAYVALDDNGVIRQCNLTAATLLGRNKSTLEGTPLFAYVAPDSRTAYLDFLRRCRAADHTGCDIEIRLDTGDGERDVQIVCRARQRPGETVRTYFTSLVDVTDRRRLEREREQLARRHTDLALRLVSIQDTERQRIARNLHDDVGQQVTSVRLALEALASVDASDRTATDDALARVLAMVEELDLRLHVATRELRPVALDLGLNTAIDQFLDSWTQASGVPVERRLASLPPGALAPERELHVYRIVQEALNNISKHARARTVSVTLEARDKRVVITIEDDGVGFDTASAAAWRKGLGLAGMEERAQLIGARLTLHSVPGEGAMVTVDAPVPRLLAPPDSPP